MQRAGHVRRRNDDRENRCVRIFVNVGREKSARLPASVMLRLGFFRIVSFGDLDHLVNQALAHFPGRASLELACFGNAVTSARSARLTDFDVGNNLARSESTTTTSGSAPAIAANRFGRAFRYSN